MLTPSPWREMEALRRDLERALQSGFVRPTVPFTVAFLPGRSARAYPLTNVSEDAENVYVQALAPGVDPDKLELTVLGNTLTIAGEKPAPEGVSPEAFHRSERSAGRFMRTIDLPVEVNSEKVEARYADGILNIKLGRADAAKPRQVQVTVE